MENNKDYIASALMAYTVKTSVTNTVVKLGLKTGSGKTAPADLTIDWGDGSSETNIKKDALIDASDKNGHTYNSPGTYTVTIISAENSSSAKQISEFSFFDSHLYPYLIAIDTPLLNSKQSDFASCFNSCTALASIPPFLFGTNTSATNFSSCFTGCTALTSIPEGLFDNCTSAAEFQYCFESCTSLTSIPAGLFDKNTNAANFSCCFRGCSKLKLKKTIFSTAGNTGRFTDKNMNFSSCFNAAGSSLASGSQGEAPELWDYTKGTGSWNITDCFTEAYFSNKTGYDTVWGTPLK